MNLLVEEIKLNWKLYSYTLLFFMITIGIIFSLKDSFVTEFYDDIYGFTTAFFIGCSFGRVPISNEEKTMNLYVKLPLNIIQLFSIRIIKSFLLSSIVPIFLLVFYFWDKQALASDNTFLISLIFFFTMMYWANLDVNVITESKGFFRNILYKILAFVILITPFVAYTYISITIKHLTESVFLNLSFLFIYIGYSLYIAFYIFKLRKNYKY